MITEKFQGEIPNVEIRPFKIEDWQMVRDLRLEALQGDPQAFGSSYEREAARSEEEWLAKYSRATGENPSDLFAIAVENEKAVGMAGAYRKEDGTYTIVSVYISPDFRGKGLSSRILEGILRQIDARPDARVLELKVNTEQESAVRLYKRFGFEITETLKDQEMGDGEKHDEYLMRKEIRRD